MRKPLLIAGGVLVLWPVAEGTAQHTATTSLVLHVNPEARLDPERVSLAFRVSADGNSDVTTASAVVAARARRAPGQGIRVTARLVNLNAQVRWTGLVLNSAGGGQQASCSSGILTPGATQDVVTGWQRSGIVTCSLNFELVDARSLPAGVYTGLVQFGL